MNESDTRLHKIDPKLKAAGWGVTEGSRITTEYTFTRGKISKTQKGKPKRADYVLIYKGVWITGSVLLIIFQDRQSINGNTNEASNELS